VRQEFAERQIALSECRPGTRQLERLDAVRQSRFAPAQTPIGRTVAVNMVWLIFVTTVQTPDPQTPVQVAPVVARTRRLPPADPAVPLPVGRQSSRVSSSPTA